MGPPSSKSECTECSARDFLHYHQEERDWLWGWQAMKEGKVVGTLKDHCSVVLLSSMFVLHDMILSEK